MIGNIEGEFIDVDFESGVTACLETVPCKEREKENGRMNDPYCKNSKQLIHLKWLTINYLRTYSSTVEIVYGLTSHCM